MGEVIKYTPTQLAILKLLGDGNRHLRSELIEILKGSLKDPLADALTLNRHLSKLRLNLRRNGQDVICEYNNRRICYRQVILIGRDS